MDNPSQYDLYIMEDSDESNVEQSFIFTMFDKFNCSPLNRNTDLAVCLPRYHFIAGRSLFENHHHAVDNSNRILCIISPENTNWIDFCRQSSFYQYILRNKADRFIPVFIGFTSNEEARRACPPELADRTAVVFSQSWEDDRESWNKLHRSLHLHLKPIPTHPCSRSLHRPPEPITRDPIQCTDRDDLPFRANNEMDETPDLSLDAVGSFRNNGPDRICADGPVTGTSGRGASVDQYDGPGVLSVTGGGNLGANRGTEPSLEGPTDDMQRLPHQNRLRTGVSPGRDRRSLSNTDRISLNTNRTLTSNTVPKTPWRASETRCDGLSPQIPDNTPARPGGAGHLSSLVTMDGGSPQPGTLSPPYNSVNGGVTEHMSCEDVKHKLLVKTDVVGSPSVGGCPASAKTPVHASNSRDSRDQEGVLSWSINMFKKTWELWSYY